MTDHTSLLRLYAKGAARVLFSAVLVFLLGFGLLQAQQNMSVLSRVVVSPNPELDTVALVDFPFTLKRHEFEFYQPDSTEARYLARVFARVRIFGTDGLQVDSASTYFGAQINSPDDRLERGIKLFNRVSIFLKPGIYTARLTIIDVVSKRESKVFFDRVEIPPTDREHLTIGGQCFAHVLSFVGDNDGRNDRLVRNGYRILCNPLSIYGPKDTVLNCYAELYNLDFDPDTESEFTMSYYLLDDSGATLDTLREIRSNKPGKSAVIAESFDIGELEIGTYGLRIVANDLSSGQVDTLVAPFQVLPAPAEAPPVLATPTDTDPYYKMTIGDKINLVRYLLTPVERQSFEALTYVGKAKYLDQYWKDHDIDPTTPELEYRDEMIRRYEYSNQHFSTDVDKTDGWSRDRGRIYMTYGEWDDREDDQNPVAGNPFEIWYYYSLREGTVFVFEDKEGYHDYTLVHSNMDGEKYSDEWVQRLRNEMFKVY